MAALATNSEIFASLRRSDDGDFGCRGLGPAHELEGVLL